MKQENRYYVYALVDPDKNLPFYVGKGTGNRAYIHLTNELTGENKFKDRIITGIRNKGKEPIVKIIKEDMLEHDAYDYEEHLISYYGKRVDNTGILTNVVDNNRPPIFYGKDHHFFGKDGPMLGKTWTIEQKKKISGKNHWSYGKEHPNKGKTKSEMHVKQMSENRKGDKNPNAKSYIIFDSVNNTKYSICCMAEWCREHDINEPAFRTAVRKKRLYKKQYHFEVI